MDLQAWKHSLYGNQTRLYGHVSILNTLDTIPKLIDYWVPIGAGIYIQETGMKMTFMRAAKWLRYYKIYGKDIAIFIDSQSLTDVYTTLNVGHP